MSAYLNEVVQNSNGNNNSNENRRRVANYHYGRSHLQIQGINYFAIMICIIIFYSSKRQFYTCRNEFNHRRNMNGIVLSHVSMSLENLLTIRPSGVVSKKDMGAFRIRDNILWCKTEADFKVPIAIKIVAAKIDTDWKNPNAP